MLWNPLSRRRKQHEEEIMTIQAKHKRSAERAQSQLKETNKRLRNGLAIKLYYASHKV